jgi:putative redox protein
MTDDPARHPAASDLRFASASWVGGLRFEGGAPGGPRTLQDGDAKDAPGPMVQLLLAVAGCSGADIVSILEKMPVRLTRLDIDVMGRRAPDHPRRFREIHLTFRIAGEGVDEPKARRAVELSVTKYCSVIHSLNPDIPVTWDLVLG